MTNHRPLILITNDDGIYAPGLKHLWQAVQQHADCFVVAPATEQSAVGLSITIRHPLRIEKIEWAGMNAMTWCINGTPADCIKLALHSILPKKPQLIISGINRGSNAGRNALYSGTVAGAIEGIMHDIPSIAFSVADFINPHYYVVEPYIQPIIQHVLSNPLPHGTLLNVNFPKNLENGIKGIRLAKQGREFWQENIDQRYHPAEGHSYYWLGARLASFTEDEDSDIYYLQNGYAAAVPINVSDLTQYDHLKQYSEAFKIIDNHLLPT